MGINYLYANLDKKAFFNPERIPDENPKWPVGPSASILFELLRGPWNGDRIALVPDDGGHPLSDALFNRDHPPGDWTDLTEAIRWAGETGLHKWVWTDDGVINFYVRDTMCVGCEEGYF